MPRKKTAPEDVRPSALDVLDPAPQAQFDPDEEPPEPPPPPEPGPYQRAVERDLDRLPRDLATGAVAAGMLRLAAEIDQGFVAGRDVSGHVREIRQSYTTLKELAPAGNKSDKTDELTTRREKRMTGKGGRASG